MTTLPSMSGAPWRPRVSSGSAPTVPTDADRRSIEHRRRGQGRGGEPAGRSDDRWVTCAECGMEVKADRLSQHRSSQH